MITREELDLEEDRWQLRRELAHDAMLDRVRKQAPECCRDCDNLVIGVEDNRFDHEFGVSGEIEYFPKCSVLNEEVFIAPMLDEECAVKIREEESNASKRTA